VLALFLVGFSVGLDNFAAAIGIGVGGVNRRVRIQVGLVFGLFEGGMPVVGLLLGDQVASTLGGAAHPIGATLLCLTGAYGIITAWRSRNEPKEAHASGQSIGRLLVAGAALSIDNLVIGFALGAYHVSLLLAAVIIGSISVALAFVGLELGRRIGQRVNRTVGEMLGGAVLILVGIAIGVDLI
jgi:putative Mn2+ efflux pump MntP